MADEQYEWLDKDAAERLLRGEPVDPVDGHARTEAARLMAALAAARGARAANGELPGEAAALAAFRAVPRAARTRGRSETQAVQAAGYATQSSEPGQPEQKGQPGRGAHPGPPETLGAIRIGPASSARSSSSFFAASSGGGGMRPRRWRRPLRFGLAASSRASRSAGWPSPRYGRASGAVRRARRPAARLLRIGARLPGGAGIGAHVRQDACRAAGFPGPGHLPGPRRPVHPRRRTPQGRRRCERPGRSGRHGGRRSRGRRRSRPRSGDGTARDSTSGGGRDGTSGKWLGRTVRACRDYRDGDLDADRRRRLVVMARGAGNLDRFCKRVLERPDGDGGYAQQGSGSGEGTDNDGPDAVRSLWFKPATPPPSAPALPAVPGTTASTR